jgi:hypothetical protein
MGRPPTMARLQASAQFTHEVIRGQSPVAQDRADTATAGHVDRGPDDGTLVLLPSGSPLPPMPAPTPEEIP